MKAEEEEWRKEAEEYRGSGVSLGGWCRRNGCKRRRLKYWIQRFSGEDDGSALGEEVSWTEMRVEDAGDDFAGYGDRFSNSLKRTASKASESTLIVRYREFELVLPNSCLGDVVKAVVKYA